MPLRSLRRSEREPEIPAFDDESLSRLLEFQCEIEETIAMGQSTSLDKNWFEFQEPG